MVAAVLRRLVPVLAVVTTAFVAYAQAPADVALSVGGRASANAGIAADGARVAVAWGARRADGATDIYLATSADGGRTFGTPVRVNDIPGSARLNGEMAPRPVFVRRAGQSPAIDVMWTGREGARTTIRLARSNDGGASFAASRELQGAGAAGDRGWGTLASDARGGVHALWLDHRAMATGEPHQHGVDMSQRSALYYSNGATARALTNGVCYCCKTALAVGSDGALFAAWRHVYPGSIRDIAVAASRDGGRTFTAPVRVSEDGWRLEGCPDDGPALAVDAAGTIHIVWPTVTTDPYAHKALFYATSRDGRVFTTRTRVSPAGRNIAHPQVAVGPGGEVLVLWDESAGGRRRPMFSRRDGTGAFAPAQALADGPASYPVPVVADGAFVVAWTEGIGDATGVVVRRLPVR